MTWHVDACGLILSPNNGVPQNLQYRFSSFVPHLKNPSYNLLDGFENHFIMVVYGLMMFSSAGFTKGSSGWLIVYHFVSFACKT